MSIFGNGCGLGSNEWIWVLIIFFLIICCSNGDGCNICGSNNSNNCGCDNNCCDSCC